MARIRSIKPEFFSHEDLFRAEKDTGLPLRLAYAGLWTAADREGRFKWKPMQLKTAALPYDEVDFSRVLDALATRGFILRYEVSGVVYGAILSWKSHQFINNKEPQSVIPGPTEAIINQDVDASATREPHVDNASPTRGVKEGKGKEGKVKNRRPSKSDVRFPDFVNALSKYWTYKNPAIKFPFSAADGKQLNTFLSEHRDVTIEQFKACLNNRAKSDMVHSQAICRWIGRTLEFAHGPLDQFWKPREGRNGVSQGISPPARGPDAAAEIDAQLGAKTH